MSPFPTKEWDYSVSPELGSSRLRWGTSQGYVKFSEASKSPWRNSYLPLGSDCWVCIIYHVSLTMFTPIFIIVVKYTLHKFTILANLSTQFSGIKYLQNVVLLLPHPSPELFASCKTETLSSFNINSLPPSPKPQILPFFLSLWYLYPTYLIQVKSYSICPLMSDFFHSNTVLIYAIACVRISF